MTSYRTDQSGIQVSEGHWDKNKSIKKNPIFVFSFTGKRYHIDLMEQWLIMGRWKFP